MIFFPTIILMKTIDARTSQSDLMKSSPGENPSPAANTVDAIITVQ